ncbi:MAG: hypothetical protein GXO64_03010, partial [Candidatus Micrarchaeota archaeon]|nr:hypothetical protein [Candidatus Micrarchaeota archaeon]
MKIKLACGTDDGTSFTNEHFGDAKFYMVYEIDTQSREIKFLKRIENTTPDEDLHGDPKKAKKISELMEGIP